MKILRLNDANPGVKRPLRIGDLQKIWDGLNATLASYVTGDTPHILSGFDVKADNTLSEGVIAFQGRLYYHPDTDGFRITLGDNVYAKEIPSDDERIFADSSEQIFSYDVIVTNTVANGTLIGAFTFSNLEAWKTAYIGESQIQSAMLANLAVTASKIGSNAISSGKIATGAVTEEKIADGAVTEAKIADGAVSTVKMANNAVTPLKVQQYMAPMLAASGASPVNVTSAGMVYPLRDFIINGYNSTTGLWATAQLNFRPQSAATTSVTLSGLVSNATELANFPYMFPLSVRNSNTDSGVILRVTLAGAGTDGVSQTVTLQQNEAINVICVKTSTGFIFAGGRLDDTILRPSLPSPLDRFIPICFTVTFARTGTSTANATVYQEPDFGPTASLEVTNVRWDDLGQQFICGLRVDGDSTGSNLRGVQCSPVVGTSPTEDSDAKVLCDGASVLMQFNTAPEINWIHRVKITAWRRVG